MRDFFMGAVVEVEELALGEAAPQETPPQGVIVSRIEEDGWTRRYLYRSYVDLSGKRVQNQVLYGEVPPQESVPPAPRAEMGRPVPFQSVSQPIMDNRLNFPAGSQVRLAGSPMMGQSALPQPPAEAPAAPEATDPLPVEAPAPGTPPPPPGLPAICDQAIQFPDGTILEPDTAITFKDFCALMPYILKAERAEDGPRRGGGIPLSRQGFGAVPSFGPAASPFGQGGGGGGGGGSPPGPGPIGVIVNNQIQGAGQSQGAPGPAGPQGPTGPGSITDGARIEADFTNAGAMAVVPGSTFQIEVGGDGKCSFEFSAVLTRVFPRASIWDVEMGIEIDGTQYKLWGNSEQQGSGDDQAFILGASGTLYYVLPLGTHTVSLIYGYNAGLNGWTLAANASQPASIICKHS